MIISFDIDNTLIPYSDEFDVEEKTLLSKVLMAESLRKGTPNLFHQLKGNGHDLWIYTTSFRSKFTLRKTFFSYGLYPSKIINQQINLSHLKRHNCSASKNPKLFGIDLHIDDSKGVEKEGHKYGFETIIVDTCDLNWSEKILEIVSRPRIE